MIRFFKANQSPKSNVKKSIVRDDIFVKNGE